MRVRKNLEEISPTNKSVINTHKARITIYVVIGVMIVLILFIGMGIPLGYFLGKRGPVISTPTLSPTQSPTLAPTQSPTLAPTQSPTLAPVQSPTLAPAQSPTSIPPTGVCCIPQTSACFRTTESQCNDMSTETTLAYYIDGNPSSCNPTTLSNPCDNGTCCQVNGNCFETSYMDCWNNPVDHSQWTDVLGCSQVNCSLILGSCCFDQCTITGTDEGCSVGGLASDSCVQIGQGAGFFLAPGFVIFNILMKPY